MHMQLTILIPTHSATTTILYQRHKQASRQAPQAEKSRGQRVRAERKETMGESGEPYLVALLGES
jgi:hypothetical protein